MRKSVYLMVLTAVMLMSCGRFGGYDDRLLLADSLMSTSPDSSLLILQSIDPDRLSSEHDRALHALLLSQAYDKNYIDLTSDSIISIAVEYYANTDEYRYAMLALYYHGRIFYNAGNFGSCIISCLEGEQCGLKIDDHFYLGMIYRLMSDAYNNTYNYSEQLKYAIKANAHFEKSGKSLHIRESVRDLSRAYCCNNEFQKSSQILSSLIQTQKSLKDTAFICACMNDYAHVQHILGNTDSVKQILTEIRYRYRRNLNATSYGHLAEIMLRNNRTDSAMFYIKKGEMVCRDLNALSVLKSVRYKLYLKQKDVQKMDENRTQMINILNQTVDSVWSQSIMMRQQEYYQNKASVIQVKAQRQRSIIVIGIIIIICVLITIAMYIRQSKIQQRLRILRIEQVNANRLRMKEDEIKALTSKVDKNEEELKFYKMHFPAEGQLQSSPQMIDVISTIREKIYQNKKVSDADLRVLHDSIIAEYPMFDIVLHDLIKLSKIEYNVCLLIKVDFAPVEIAQLLCVTRSAISNIRTRLFKKTGIENQDFKNWDEFIKSI